ncbi:MAG: pyruvate kinase [Alphaproteobacteria bacterium]
MQQQQNIFRQTKILATLGPASQSEEQIEALYKAGANAFRLNFSHGKHEDLQNLVDNIRAVEKKHGRPIGIVADLQGPKLRIGEFVDGKITLTEGQDFRFDLDLTAGDEKRVSLPHPEVLGVLEEGALIFLDDGKVRARVKKSAKDHVIVEILSGTKLSNRKGLNVPGAIIPIPALTEKDRKDLAAALDMGVDWIAQSFVQRPEDVAEARKLMSGANGKMRAALMVKIEKPAALACLEELLDLADGAMLARGDLGIEIPPEDVPSVQKRVVRAVRERGKPMVVATQMLESMIENPRPTRAEASDVATAVYDGADAVMLSAETAAGAYPVRAVEMMNRIACRTEMDETYAKIMEDMHPDTVGDPSDAITTAAYYVAQDIDARVIVTYTMSGSTALRAARQRPNVPIACLTPDYNVARRLSLSYGVHGIHAPETVEDFTGPATHAGAIIKSRGFAQSGDKFVMTAGMPFGTPGSTNILRIAWVE